MGRPAFAGATRDPEAVAADLEALPSRPLISVVMPTYETEPRHLREAIWSVATQEYPYWELVIVDDGSTNRSTRRELTRWGARDERIVVRMLDRNSGISAATNQAIEHCRGELVAFLDHDDALTADALLRVAHAFCDGEVDVAYSDQDKITARGERTDPFLKPDWSPVYALGAMYVGHLLVARRELIREAGGLDPAFDGIQDFELLLRMSERTDRIHHLDRVLYHWRATAGSVALDPSEKPGIDELQARAVNEHLRRHEIRARAVPHGEVAHRLRLEPEPLDAPPSVSVVIPTRDGKATALAPLLERTSYPSLEVVVVQPEWVGGNGALTEGVIQLGDPSETFNPGRSGNLGAARASGEWLVFLGEDTEVTEPDWIQRLLAHAGLPGVGAVAPALTRPDGRVDEAGLAIGLYDPVVPAMQGITADSDGYYGSLSCAREVSALGMDCLLIRRSDFDRIGGFEEAYSRQHQAHDLCMRLAELGLSSVCAPGPRTIIHSTEAQRLADFDVADRALFVERFYERLEAGDPYYNRGFFRAAADYALPPFRGDPFQIALRETVG
jgi:glycosyltransferase involved in cell wall biosynthesis